MRISVPTLKKTRQTMYVWSNIQARSETIVAVEKQ